jgi:primosomal protein N' (replication factor Y)
VGKGTEQLEEQVTALLSGQLRADGQPLCVARMDADSTRAKGSLEAQLARMHSGEVDVLVGTQMVAKGHDFRRITLVAAINADAALFAADYRAAERLFSLLMQSAGRAGREASLSQGAEMWVQTWNPAHPLFAALRRHDYPAFAAQQLEERQGAQMPPFGHQAVLRAEAHTQEAAQAFLAAAREVARDLPGAEHLSLYPPVPMAVQRVARVERAQMLLESESRPVLQKLLSQWRPMLDACRKLPQAKGLIRWAIDVDPVSI